MLVNIENRCIELEDRDKQAAGNVRRFYNFRKAGVLYAALKQAYVEYDALSEDARRGRESSDNAEPSQTDRLNGITLANREMMAWKSQAHILDMLSEVAPHVPADIKEAIDSDERYKEQGKAPEPEKDAIYPVGLDQKTSSVVIDLTTKRELAQNSGHFPTEVA